MYGLVYGVYIYIYICVYAQIYVRGTFVYCASFVFVVNKLKMRPNWQRRHSICMRGVRGTLDRQPRLEELCAHGQHKRCFKQPPPPSPLLLPLFPSLSLSSNLSNTFTLRATSMDAFRIAKTLCGVSSYPKCLFPPFPLLQLTLLVIVFAYRRREREGGGGVMLGLRPTWLEFAKGSKCCMALGASPWPQIVSSSSTAPQIGIAVRGRTTQRQGEKCGEGRGGKCKCKHFVITP